MNFKKTYKCQADLVYLIAVLFVVVIAIFAVDNIWSGFQSNPQTQKLFNATPQGQLAQKSVNTGLNIFNNAVVFLFIGAAIASIIAAAFTDSSPVFMVPTLVILPIEILFAFIFHDAFFSIIQQSAFASMAATYPSIVYLFQYLPLAALGLAVLMITITFVK